MSIEQCIVKVVCGKKHGTGFWVAPDAILTCEHVAPKGSENELQASMKLEVEKIVVHPIKDMALIKLKRSQTTIPPAVFMSDLP
jgi:hypothetical protein